MALHPNYRIDLRVEINLPAEALNPDAVLFEALKGARISLGGEELKELLECGGIPKGSRLQDSPNLVLTLLDARRLAFCGYRAV